MTIGAGIAIAGAWLFAGMVCVSDTTNNAAAWLSLIIAIGVTAWLK